MQVCSEEKRTELGGGGVGGVTGGSEETGKMKQHRKSPNINLTKNTNVL